MIPNLAGNLARAGFLAIYILVTFFLFLGSFLNVSSLKSSGTSIKRLVFSGKGALNVKDDTVPSNGSVFNCCGEKILPPPLSLTCLANCISTGELKLRYISKSGIHPEFAFSLLQ